MTVTETVLSAISLAIKRLDDEIAPLPQFSTKRAELVEQRNILQDVLHRLSRDGS